MDLNETAAYNGGSFEERSVRELPAYDGRLSVAVLAYFNPRGPGVIDGHPDEYQFLREPKSDGIRQELNNYSELLNKHGTEVRIGDAPYPNMIYSADSLLGIGEGQVMIGRMASDIRRKGEHLRFRQALELGFDPLVPYPPKAVFEVSNIIPTPRGYIVGVGNRSDNRSAIKTREYIESEGKIVDTVETPGDVQHLMGMLRPLPDGRAAIRPEKFGGDLQPVEHHYEGTVEFEESKEVTHKEGMNFVVADDGTIIMPDDTPMVEAKLRDSGYSVETTTIEHIRAGAGGLACVTGRIA